MQVLAHGGRWLGLGGVQDLVDLRVLGGSTCSLRLLALSGFADLAVFGCALGRLDLAVVGKKFCCSRIVFAESVLVRHLLLSSCSLASCWELEPALSRRHTQRIITCLPPNRGTCRHNPIDSVHFLLVLVRPREILCNSRARRNRSHHSIYSLCLCLQLWVSTSRSIITSRLLNTPDLMFQANLAIGLLRWWYSHLLRWCLWIPRIVLVWCRCFICCAAWICTIKHLADLPWKVIIGHCGGANFDLRVVTQILTDQVKLNIVVLFHVFVAEFGEHF